MPKKDKIIEPIHANPDEVAASIVNPKNDLKKADTSMMDDIPVAVAKGFMNIGGVKIACAVLADETRLISDRGVSAAIGTKRPGSHWERARKADPGAVILPPYISADNLKPFIPKDLEYILTNPIHYRVTDSGAKGNGLLATAFPKVLNVWAKAYEAGALKPQQEHIGKQAQALCEGLDEVAIIALIDEATGYQEKRRQDELQQILSAYVLPEHRPYLRSVPLEFFKELYRVYGWQWSSDNRGPRYAGKLLRKLIYEKLPEPVLPELDKLNPSKGVNYQRDRKHFQNLSLEVGVPHFQGQLSGVMALLRASPSANPKAFERLFRRAYGDQLELDLDEEI